MFREIAVRELQPGDLLLDKGRAVYEILEVTRHAEGSADGRMWADVRWHDGGLDTRVWSTEALDHRVTVERAADRG